MKISAVLREAWRNVVSGTSRAVIFAVALGALGGGLLVADLVASRQVADEAAQFQSSGASITTLVAEGEIDGRTCDALGSLPGVRAAGALRSVETPLRPATLPNSPIPVSEATVGFPEMLVNSMPVRAGILLSRDAADQLALEAGDVLTMTTGVATVSEIYAYPDDGRRPGLGYAAIVVATDSRPFDECWVDSWPQIPAMGALILTTIVPSNSTAEQTKPLLSQLNSTLGARFDGQTRFLSRVTLFAAPLSIIVAFVLGFVSIRIRRLQIASALHSRVTRKSLARMLVLETLSWCIPVAAVASAITLGFSTTGPPNDRGAMLWLGLRFIAPIVVGPLAGALVALSLTRETHLFRYFKDR